jgi:catechol 2,3-dioxygenase-like lactoylglutathione lyase family enzyme
MSSDPPRPSPPLSAIDGFRLVSADLGGLSRFYRDVLGFVADGAEQAISGDEMRLLGLPGTGRRHALRLGAQSLAIEQFDPPGRPYPAGANAASLSFQHFALVVDDMAQAYQRVRGAAAITEGGPQHLPAASGGVLAYKFRDPDGHPLELLQFPDARRPPAWQGRSASATQVALGIDHSAISIADTDVSVAFYGALGLTPGERTLNHGPRQQCLDNLEDVMVTVTPMRAGATTPHLELLSYRGPRGAAGTTLLANDIAATRIVWRGQRAALLRDPDGHLHQIAAPRLASHGIV